MKNLKTKRMHIYSIYRSLELMPPGEFPKTTEIDTTVKDILPAMKEQVTAYIKILDKIDDVNRKFRKKKIGKSELDKSLKKFTDEFNDYDDVHGDDIITVKFEDEVFKVFNDQFEREGWGQKYVNSIKKYSELSKDIEDASEGKEDPKEDK